MGRYKSPTAFVLRIRKRFIYNNIKQFRQVNDFILLAWKDNKTEAEILSEAKAKGFPIR